MNHPDNVKDLLEEVKNLSGLMLDLAYSAVFFKNIEIAEEVILSFDKFKDLEERLYKELFAASRGEKSGSLISVIEIIESAKTVTLAARNMAEMILDGRELHPVIHEALKDSDETIVRAVLSFNSLLTGKTLKYLQLGAEVGIVIVGIRRKYGEGKDHEWIFYPRGSVEFQEGDVVIGIGSHESCEKLTDLASGKLNSI